MFFGFFGSDVFILYVILFFVLLPFHREVKGKRERRGEVYHGSFGFGIPWFMFYFSRLSFGVVLVQLAFITVYYSFSFLLFYFVSAF